MSLHRSAHLSADLADSADVGTRGRMRTEAGTLPTSFACHPTPLLPDLRHLRHLRIKPGAFA